MGAPRISPHDPAFIPPPPRYHEVVRPASVLLQPYQDGYFRGVASVTGRSNHADEPEDDEQVPPAPPVPDDNAEVAADVCVAVPDAAPVKMVVEGLVAPTVYESLGAERSPRRDVPVEHLVTAASSLKALVGALKSLPR